MQLRMLICLLSFRAKNTDTVWPSRDELSERSGYSPSVCSRVTTQLVELGWLEKHQRGRKRSAVYKVTVPDLDTVSDGKSVTTPVTGTGNVNSDQFGNSDQIGNGDQDEPETVTTPDTKQLPNWSQPYEHTKNIPGTDQCNTTSGEHPIFSQHVTQSASTRTIIIMSPDWRPSEHVFEKLDFERKIPRHFAEQQLAGFVLYHDKTSNRHGAFDSKFHAHVIHNWESSKTIERPIAADWLPDQVTVKRIRQAGVPSDFIQERVIEFVMFWRESGRPGIGWNAKFYDAVLRAWNRVQPAGSGARTAGAIAAQQSTDQSMSNLVSRLTDRSWAEG